MYHEHYPRVIQEWCVATGMSAWGENEDQHVDIDGTVVGLIPAGEHAPDLLQVFIDLGHIDQPDLHTRLLEQNTQLDQDDYGYFGLHPLTHALVYRTQLRLNADTDGSQLPYTLRNLINNAQKRLDQSRMQ